jgi:hypothetical protein
MDEPPDFPIGKPTNSPWREQTRARVTELRGLTAWVLRQPDRKNPGDDQMAQAIAEHLTAAYMAAATKRRLREKLGDAWSGAAVTRAQAHLDLARAQLLEIAPMSYIRGQLPSISAFVHAHLNRADKQCIRIKLLLDQPAVGALGESDRIEIVSAFRDAATEARNEVSRVRSFRNILLVMSVVLAFAAAGMAFLGVVNPRLVRVCFTPNSTVICPTEQTAVAGPTTGVTEAAVAGQLDIAIVELLGLLGAAVAAAASLRKVRGTSTPYSLPLALAVLKLPTGALTALLGLVLMRGEFVPGLTDLDTQGQILGWAIVFGSAQHLVTRVVDQKAQDVLESVGGREKTPVGPVAAPAPA